MSNFGNQETVRMPAVLTRDVAEFEALRTAELVTAAWHTGCAVGFAIACVVFFFGTAITLLLVL